MLRSLFEQRNNHIFTVADGLLMCAAATTMAEGSSWADGRWPGRASGLARRPDPHPHAGRRHIARGEPQELQGRWRCHGALFPFFSIACVIRTHAVLNVQAGSHIGHADKQQGIILNSKYESELRDVRCHEGRTLGGCVRLLAHLSEMAEQC